MAWLLSKQPRAEFGGDASRIFRHQTVCRGNVHHNLRHIGEEFYKNQFEGIPTQVHP